VYFTQDDDSDNAAVAECLAGHSEAFAPVVEKYQRVMYVVAYRTLGNEADASDAAQTAFVKAYQQLATFDSRHRFFSWLYRILRNECLNVIRARRPQEPLSAALKAASTPFDAARLSEQRRDVQVALDALVPEEREVIVLRHYAELRYDEIAATLGIPASTVKSRLYSARQHMGQRLLGWREA
jgi:RNA polymerase sigma-70 factor (ECF subfamily)